MFIANTHCITLHWFGSMHTRTPQPQHNTPHHTTTSVFLFLFLLSLPRVLQYPPLASGGTHSYKFRDGFLIIFRVVYQVRLFQFHLRLRFQLCFMFHFTASTSIKFSCSAPVLNCLFLFVSFQLNYEEGNLFPLCVSRCHH